MKCAADLQTPEILNLFVPLFDPDSYRPDTYRPNRYREMWLNDNFRRGVRVVEGARLESVYTGNGIEGSNPSLSASEISRSITGIFVFPADPTCGSSRCVKDL